MVERMQDYNDADVSIATVTLCGSMRFFDPHMLNAAAELTMMRYVVLMPYALPQTMDERTKKMVDKLHFEKIRKSDSVMVVTDDERYIGASTAREIAYARRLYRPVFYWLLPSGTIWLVNK